MNASSTDRSTETSEHNLPSATIPLRLTSHLKRVRQCKRDDGCLRDCSWDRTDGERLPWNPDGQYGGWGGHEYHGTMPGIGGPPVVFVHGNQRDACDWDAYAEFFRERGFGGDECWAITFRDGTPTHDEMATQLDTFVTNVCDQTGADQVHVIAHSLGVTGVRYWLEREQRYDSVDTFVGLAGANHGQTLSYWCQVAGLDQGVGQPSEFLRADYDSIPGHPLADLNDENETPGDVAYYTIRGTDDPLFWQRDWSPKLDGAERNVELRTDHDGVRTSLESKERIYQWFTGRTPYNLDALCRT